MFKTLVVDDEKIDRDGICFLLQKLSIPTATVQAQNGMAALEILKHECIDVLFTDIKMPLMDGLELIREAEKINPRLKIIIYSAHDDFQYAKSAMQFGVKNYLLKPIIIEEFRTCMNQVIEECRQELRISKRKICNEFLLSDDENTDIYKLNLPSSVLLVDFSKIVISNADEIATLLEDVLGNNCVATTINNYQLFVFFNRQSARCTLTDVLEDLGGKYDGVVTLVDGGECANLNEVRELLELMDYALDNKFYAAENNIILLSEHRNIPSGEESESIESLEAQIDLYIKQGEKSRIKQKIKEVFRVIAEKGSISVIYTKHLAINIAKKCFSASIMDAKNKNAYLQKVLLSNQLETMQDILNDIVDHSINVNLNNGDEIIDRVIKMIEQEYKDDISLESIAERVFLTPSYLSFLFKRQTGKNFVKYLTAFRIEKSKQLLDDTNLQISVISESVGYVNVSYFCLIFKNHMGITPMQYRERKTSVVDEF